MGGNGGNNVFNLEFKMVQTLDIPDFRIVMHECFVGLCQLLIFCLRDQYNPKLKCSHSKSIVRALFHLNFVKLLWSFLNI